MNFFGGMISQLERGLNFSATKGKVISQNIANVDTPNYKAKNVSFKEVFANAQTNSLEAYRTDARHIDFNIKYVHIQVFSITQISAIDKMETV